MPLKSIVFHVLIILTKIIVHSLMGSTAQLCALYVSHSNCYRVPRHKAVSMVLQSHWCRNIKSPVPLYSVR
jgi:hypothetical protein